MATDAFEHAINPGETLVADVSECMAPFGWVAIRGAAAGELEHRFSVSKEMADAEWIEPASNGSITKTAASAELDPLRWLRWRHVSGGAFTIQIGAVGRVAWHVSS